MSCIEFIIFLKCEDAYIKNNRQADRDRITLSSVISKEKGACFLDRLIYNS